MKDVIFDDFQNSVDESLLRHKSILDVITKLQESQSRINRAVAKSVTNCGCIKINAKKQKLPEECDDIDNLSSCFCTHLEGELCDNCREIIEGEIGNNLFYLTSLCNILGISLYDVLLKEYGRINTLGKYTFR
jgi:NTP pyrophosphatase (non-canonical NTP hydrolase)